MRQSQLSILNYQFSISKVVFYLLLTLILNFTNCRIQEIQQPKSAQPGEIIEVSIAVYDDLVPEPNPHKGLLCILIPQDWSFVSGEYRGTLGPGQLELAPEWADSVEACYPAADFGENMKWIGLTSDTGYAYENPILAVADVKLQVGPTQGCFELAYLVTKATQGLICAGDPNWAPLSYPHQIGVPDSCLYEPVLTVQPAVEWDELFDRASGWTGADGIYSIPLSGLDVATDSASETTLFVFSDTFIGEVDSNNHRQNSGLVNNTLALLNNNRPDSDNIDFLWENDAQGRRATIFVPDTPESNPGDWYWLMDGISIDDRIYVFGLRMEKGQGGVFNFAIAGVTLISFSSDSVQRDLDYQQVDTPLFYHDETENFQIVLGQAVMSMTSESGNPDPDGYIYVYGPRNKLSQKELVAARVLPENFENFTEWRFWDGTNWSAEIKTCAPITDKLSQEFSVSALENGQFLAVFQTGSQVSIRFGESPVGPFAPYQTIYECPEIEIDPSIFVYNAKAHPHLSKPGELLISYNVNTFDFWDHFSNADIYRPRFISLKLSEKDPVTVISPTKVLPESFFLEQNFPNPFNSSTHIKFSLFEKVKVCLKIYNLTGQEIRTLSNTVQSPGSYLVQWDGKDDLGTAVSSGIYIYRLQVNQMITSRKMLLIR